LTSEGIDPIHTFSSVETRQAAALIDVELAVSSIVAIGTLAGESVDLILASSTVLARAAQALINVHIARETAPAGITRTLKTSNPIETLPIVARIVSSAFINILAAVFSIESASAVAAVAPEAVDAGSSVLARTPQALVVILLAALSLDARQTGTDEGAARRRTRSAVNARIDAAEIDGGAGR